MADGLNNAADRRGRPFAKGEGGRPKGSRNRRTRLAEELMDDDLEGVVKAVIAAAKGGDMVAARIVLDRLAPARKGCPVSFPLPDDVDAAGIAEAFGSVLRAVAEGEISPEEGQAIASLLEARRKAIETAEIEARITALEARGAR
jgi:hypothetical protein